MAGPQHCELVVKNSKTAQDNAIAVYVTDHAGTKIATAGATGSVTLLAGKSKASVELKPAGDNVLEGRAVYASTPDLKAVVSITLAGQPAQQARFTPLAKAAAAAASDAAAHQHMH
jgi:ubiquitin